jgi:hypothetical protein
MTQCISRRACADRDTFRLLGSKGENKYHIWTEYRCPNMVSNNTETCVECSHKIPKWKYQANSKCDHGVIGGPYTTDSKLYGSPYYLEKIKEGYIIKPEDEIRAKEAVTKASSDMPARKVKVETVTAEPVKKQRKPRVTKTQVVPTVTMSSTPLPAKFVEVVAPPLVVDEFIVVKVKKIRCQGKDYYFDSMSGKLYKCMEDGVGDYCGRYNEEAEIIDATYPDSDNE